jgi:L-seryl-tRNA(Ser) seleniumtransferase
MLQVTEGDLRDRATAISSRLGNLPLQIAIGCGTARVGGGTLPKSTTSSVTIEMVPKNCSFVEFAARLRKSAPPLIGYIASNRFKIDLRTIFPQQDDLVVDAIRSACAETL